MDLTIASFHARFTAPRQDRLVAALRRLCRLADVRQVVDLSDLPVWDAPVAANREEESPSRA